MILVFRCDIGIWGFEEKLCRNSCEIVLWEKCRISFSPLQLNLIDVGRNCFQWEAGSVWDNRGFEEWSPAEGLWKKKKDTVVSELSLLPKEKGKHFYLNKNKFLKDEIYKYEEQNSFYNAEYTFLNSAGIEYKSHDKYFF